MFLKSAQYSPISFLKKIGLVYKSSSLATRLTTWYTCSAFGIILIATGILYLALAQNMQAEDDEFLENKIEHLKPLLSRADLKSRALPELERELIPQHYPKILVRFLNSNGESLLETPGMVTEFGAELPTRAAPSDRGLTIQSKSNRSYRVLTEKLEATSQDSYRVIQVAMDREYEEQLLKKYRERIWLVLACALIACAWVGYQVVNKGIRPVKEMIATAKRIRSSTLYERIEKKDLPSELLLLAETFNEMLDRLEESFTRISQFSDDIAHELRTPINNLRGQTEVALSRVRTADEYRETLESCMEDSIRMSQMIHSLLFLSRAEHPQTQIQREEIQIARELRAAQEFYEASAQEAGVSLEIDSDQNLKASLDRILFQRAIGNLIANAISYTPSGGHVKLVAVRENSHIQVKVADTGCGISFDHLPHVFDRFYRIDRARANSGGNLGLGLSMVKSIVTLHGGSVQIASELGKGTEVILEFPI